MEVSIKDLASNIVNTTFAGADDDNGKDNNNTIEISLDLNAVIADMVAAQQRRLSASKSSASGTIDGLTASCKTPNSSATSGSTQNNDGNAMIIPASPAKISIQIQAPGAQQDQASGPRILLSSENISSCPGAHPKKQTSSAGSSSSSSDKSSKKKEMNDAAILDTFVELPCISEDKDKDDESSSQCSDITGLTGCRFETAEEEHPPVKEVTKKPSSKVARASVPRKHKKAKAAANRKSNKSATTPPSPPPSRGVSFGEVHVRSYERILSDNPACTAGPSIGIGWEYVEHKPVTLEDWEMVHRRVRSSKELVMSRKCRETLLQNWHVTGADIARMMREIKKTKRQRSQTVINLGAQPIEETVEGAIRGVKRFAFFLG